MSSGKGQGSMWGTIIGGILGAIVGALTYGTGAYFGYAAGFAIGSAIGGFAGYLIDPPAMAPDSQALGSPQTQELMGTTAQDGLPVPDLVGTTKCGGNLMGYWRNRAVETTETYDGGGGKGGGDSEKVTQVTGHQYYLTWAMGLCLGPVDELLAIYRKEVCVWHGELACPESGGFRTLVIEDIGRINFYYGTDDQPRDSRLNEMVGEANNPAYRGLCYAVFVDCCLGNYNRLPEFWFVIRKRPEFAWSPLGEVYENYNPAHALYYTLTEMAGVDSSYINEDSFTAAAETLSDEKRGLSCYFDRQTSAGSYIDTILTHMRGLLRYGADGLFHLVLIRRDTSGSVPVLNADELASGLKLTRPSAVEVKNEIKVQFTRLVYEKGSEVWSRGYADPGVAEYYPAVATYDLATVDNTWIKRWGTEDVSVSYADNRLKLSSNAAGAIYLTQVTEGVLTDNWSFKFRIRAVNGGGGWWNFGVGSGDKISSIHGTPAYMAFGLYVVRDGLPDTNWHKIKVMVRSTQNRCDLYFDDILVESDIPYTVGTLAPTLADGYVVWWINWFNDSGDPPTMPYPCSVMIDDVLITTLAPDFDEEIVVVRDEAGQRGLGRVSQSTVKAGMFNSVSDAVWFGELMLRQAMYPAAQVVIQGRRELMQWETGDLFDLTYTPYGLSGRRFRVTGLEEADLSSEAVTLHAVEDVDELMSEITYERGGRLLLPEVGLHSSGSIPTPPAEIPREILIPRSEVMIMEPPYIPGFVEGRRNTLAVAVSRALGTEDMFSVGISEDGESYVGAGTGRQFCVHGVLLAEYPAGTLKIDDTVGLLLEVPWDADRIETISRSRAIAGSNLALVGTELISFETFTPTENENEYLALGVVRGLLDTEPEDHSTGDDFYWLYDPPFIHLTENSMAALGAEPYLKVLTFAPSGASTTSLSEAVEQSVTGGVYERSLCPYPPANLMANGMDLNHRYSTDVVLTWRTRIRGQGCGIGDPDFVMDTVAAWEGTFTINVVVGAVIVRTATGIDAASWTYTEAMNLADNTSLASEVTFQVRGDLDVNHHSGWVEVMVKKE